MSSEHRIYGELNSVAAETINTMCISNAALATGLSAEKIRALRDGGQIMFPIQPKGYAHRVFVSRFHRVDFSAGFGLIRDEYVREMVAAT